MPIQRSLLAVEYTVPCASRVPPYGARDAALVRSWYGSYAFWGGTFRFVYLNPTVQRATDINSQHDRRMAHDRHMTHQHLSDWRRECVASSHRGQEKVHNRHTPALADDPPFQHSDAIRLPPASPKYSLSHASAPAGRRGFLPGRRTHDRRLAFREHPREPQSVVIGFAPPQDAQRDAPDHLGANPTNPGHSKHAADYVPPTKQCVAGPRSMPKMSPEAA